MVASGEHCRTGTEEQTNVSILEDFNKITFSCEQLKCIIVIQQQVRRFNWNSTCSGRKEKSEKLATAGLEPRVSD